MTFAIPFSSEISPSLPELWQTTERMQDQLAETDSRMGNARHQPPEVEDKEPHHEQTRPCEQADREHAITYGQMTVDIDGQKVIVRTMKNSDLRLFDW